MAVPIHRHATGQLPNPPGRPAPPERKTRVLMDRVLIIIDQPDDWAPYYPTASLVTAQEFLTRNELGQKGQLVFNLCSDMDYMSSGYYCSLLAEARGAKVMPSVKTLNDLSNYEHDSLIRIKAARNPKLPAGNPTASDQTDIVLQVFFGKCQQTEWLPLARTFFEEYMAPILKLRIRAGSPPNVESVELGKLHDLSDTEQTLFANSLDVFSRKVWPRPRRGKNYRYDLAILHNPQDKLAPSNPRALRNFVKAGNDLGLQVEMIQAEDFSRIAEFDALFIRETTAVTNHTYRFAKRAEREGLVVIDSPTAILRCTNKVFLKELLESHRIATPRSRMLLASDNLPPEQILDGLGAPVVLKIPDGSFSIGVELARDAQELGSALERLFGQSSILLAQEYLPTEFDWRIGVLDGRPIYACKYFMARGHWQIYKHTAHQHRSGESESIGVSKVPRGVLQIAARACRLIGDGFFGVDIKEFRGEPVIIEVNDNPSIDAGVEDEYLGEELYRIIMGDFLRRLDESRR